jgi:hypothetical protein
LTCVTSKSDQDQGSEMALHFIQALWGRDYIDTFVNVVLPNHLSEGNLPALRDRERSLYHIITLDQDVATIRESRSYREVQKIIPTKLTCVSGDRQNPNRWLRWNQLLETGIQEAARSKASMIFPCVDLVWSVGAFSRLEALANSGCRLVLACGLRTLKDRVMPLLADHKYSRDGILQIPSRDLVSMTLNNLHPIANQFFWDSPQFTACPANIYWRAGNDALLARCFHLHPVLVTSDGYRPLSGTIDTDFIYYACPDLRKAHIVTDSDELAFFDLCDLSRMSAWPDPVGHSTIPGIANWAAGNTNLHHRQFFNAKIILRGTGFSEGSGLADVVADSDAIVEAINGLIPHYDQARLLEERLSRVIQSSLHNLPYKIAEELEPLIQRNLAAQIEELERRTLAARFLRKVRQEGLSGTLRAVLRRLSRNRAA